MRSALLCASSAEKLFIIEQCRSVCGRSGIAFSRDGVLGLTGAAPHPALRATFPRRVKVSTAAIQFPAQVKSFWACPLPLGGAVAQRLRGYKWRSEKSVKAIAPTGAALAFLCFDFFFRIVKGEQPLETGCGSQHPLRALGGTRVLLAAAPTTPPCFRRWRRSSSLLLRGGWSPEVGRGD